MWTVTEEAKVDESELDVCWSKLIKKVSDDQWKLLWMMMSLTMLAKLAQFQTSSSPTAFRGAAFRLSWPWRSWRSTSPGLETSDIWRHTGREREGHKTKLQSTNQHRQGGHEKIFRIQSEKRPRFKKRESQILNFKTPKWISMSGKLPSICHSFYLGIAW